MWRLQEILAEVSGLHAVSLQPAAGSQGELTGLMLMRAYFADRGEGEQRRKIVIPRHRARHEPGERDDGRLRARRRSQTDARGNIDVDDLRGKVDEHTAGLMLTNPSTLGLFDENIEEIARDLPRRRRAHVLRRREPERRLRDLAAGRHGLRHRPHQPAQDVLAAARRRRPGRRADRRPRRLEPFLPVPAVVARRRRASGSTTTGRSRSARCAASPARSASSSARTRTSARTGRSCARCPRSPC